VAGRRRSWHLQTDGGYLNRSLTAFSTLVVVAEMSKASLVSGVVSRAVRRGRWCRTPTEGAERRKQDHNDRGTGAQAAGRGCGAQHDGRIPDGVALRPAP
jgi:hypothetical protein